MLLFFRLEPNKCNNLNVESSLPIMAITVVELGTKNIFQIDDKSKKNIFFERLEMLKFQIDIFILRQNCHQFRINSGSQDLKLHNQYCHSANCHHIWSNYPTECKSPLLTQCTELST